MTSMTPRLRPWQILAATVLLTGAALLAYWPALTGGFLWDDDTLVTDSTLVKAPDGLYRMWFTTEPLDYWPLTNTSFWLEWRLWGMRSSGYHATNLLRHLVSGLLVWAILRRLSIRGGLLAAALFVLHPVNVESDAWIAQRKNTLSMVFFPAVDPLVPQGRSRTGRCSPGRRVLETEITSPSCGFTAGRTGNQPLVLAQPRHVRPRDAQQGLRGNPAGRPAADRLVAAGAIRRRT
jgi:hypothetical protein